MIVFIDGKPLLVGEVVTKNDHESGFYTCGNESFHRLPPAALNQLLSGSNVTFRTNGHKYSNKEL